MDTSGRERSPRFATMGAVGTPARRGGPDESTPGGGGEPSAPWARPVTASATGREFRALPAGAVEGPRPSTRAASLFAMLALMLGACETDICIEAHKTFAECSGEPWGPDEQATAATICSEQDRASDAFHHCFIACLEGDQCVGEYCYVQCLCYTPDGCDTVDR
jgi:hypothetical protein